MILKIGAVGLLGGSLLVGACVPGCGLNLGYNGRGPVAGMQCHPPRGGYGYGGYGGRAVGYPVVYAQPRPTYVLVPQPQPVYHVPINRGGGVWRSPYWW